MESCSKSPSGSYLYVHNLFEGLSYPVWSRDQRVQVVVSCTSTIYSKTKLSSVEPSTKSPSGSYLYVHNLLDGLNYPVRICDQRVQVVVYYTSTIYSMDEAIQ